MGFSKGRRGGRAALLLSVGLAGARVVQVEPNWAELVVRFLTNPLVSPLLLSLGLLGLVFEIKHGAFGLGGLLSLLSLGLFFGSSFILGLAGWEVVLLLGLGAIALAVEVFVLPGFGVGRHRRHRGDRHRHRAGPDRRGADGRRRGAGARDSRDQSR